MFHTVLLKFLLVFKKSTKKNQTKKNMLDCTTPTKKKNKAKGMKGMKLTQVDPADCNCSDTVVLDQAKNSQ